MISVIIPGNKKLNIEYAVFDFNGTMGTDGEIEKKLEKKIEDLSKVLKIYVVSSDTYGTVKKQCDMLPVETVVLHKNEGGAEKKKFVLNLGAEKTVCIGNGNNDMMMFEVAGLSLVIIGKEGAAYNAVKNADVIFTTINDAIDFLLKNQRMVATLRK